MTEKMPPLSMVRMTIDIRTLSAFAARMNLLDDDLGYALHVASRRLFGDDGPQPMRIMDSGSGRSGGPSDDRSGL